MLRVASAAAALLLLILAPHLIAAGTIPNGEYCKTSDSNKATVTISDNNNFVVALSGFMTCSMSGTYTLSDTNQITWNVQSTQCGSLVSILSSSYNPTAEEITVTLSAYYQTVTGTASKSQCTTSAPPTQPPTGNGNAIGLGKYCGAHDAYAAELWSQPNFEFHIVITEGTAWSCYANGTYVMTSDTKVFVTVALTDCEVVVYPNINYFSSNDTIVMTLTAGDLSVTETMTEAKCATTAAPTTAAPTTAAPTTAAPTTAAPTTAAPTTAAPTTAEPTTAAPTTAAPTTAAPTTAAPTTAAPTTAAPTTAEPTTAAPTTAAPTTAAPTTAAPTTAAPTTVAPTTPPAPTTPAPTPTAFAATDTYCGTNSQSGTVAKIVIVDSGIVVNFPNVPCAWSGSYYLASSAGGEMFLDFHSSSTCSSTTHAISKLTYTASSVPTPASLTMEGTAQSSSNVDMTLTVAGCAALTPSPGTTNQPEPLSVIAATIVLEGSNDAYSEMLNADPVTLTTAIKQDLAVLFNVSVSQITITRLQLGSLDVSFTINDVPEEKVTAVEATTMQLKAAAMSPSTSKTNLTATFASVVTIYQEKGGSVQAFTVGAAAVDEVRAAPPPSSPNSSGATVPIIAVVTILVVLGVAGGVVVFMRDKNENNGSSKAVNASGDVHLEERMLNGDPGQERKAAV